MQDYQNCQFVGKLLDDPEVRYSSDTQQANATFKLMVHRGKDKNGENKGADFPRFKAFGKTAENIEKYCHKDDKLFIQKSHFRTSSYTDRNGETVYTNDFIVDEWTLMYNKKEESSESAESSEGGSWK